ALSDEIAEQRAERKLVDSRSIAVVIEGKNHGTGAVRRTETPVQFRAMQDDGATLARVSTLFTAVGFPKRPTVTGNGGFWRGHAFLPSITSSTAVSSPAT